GILGGVEQSAIEFLEFLADGLQILIQAMRGRIKASHELFGENPLANRFHESFGAGEEVRQCKTIAIEKLGLASLNQGCENPGHDRGDAGSQAAIDSFNLSEVGNF